MSASKALELQAEIALISSCDAFDMQYAACRQTETSFEPSSSINLRIPLLLGAFEMAICPSPVEINLLKLKKQTIL